MTNESSSPRFDEIGQWSEVKLDIVQKYAEAYSTIMAKKPYFNTYYIDAFCGAGMHINKDTRESVMGSPLRVLDAKPFGLYYFIDLEGKKIEFLRELCQKHFPDANIRFKRGDCNCVLRQLLPGLRREKFDRLLCFLDPYGLHLQWDIIKMMGQNKISDIVLNFPIMDINRNALWKQERADSGGVRRLNAFWGDESWRNVAYKTMPTLLGDESHKRPDANIAVADAFRHRLQNEAGFQFVPKPIPMRNSSGATVYYLFFASANAVANKIASHIFNKYEK